MHGHELTDTNAPTWTYRHKTHKHRLIHILVKTLTDTDKCIDINKLKHIVIFTHTYTLSHLHTHTHSHLHTYTFTHTLTGTLTHTPSAIVVYFHPAHKTG